MALLYLVVVGTVELLRDQHHSHQVITINVIQDGTDSENNVLAEHEWKADMKTG